MPPSSRANRPKRGLKSDGRSTQANPRFMCATTAPASIWHTLVRCSDPFSACTGRPSFQAPASAWPPCSASFTATAGASGPKRKWTGARRSTSHLGDQMSAKTILLIEDNPSDIELTQRALERSHVANELVVAHDGQEALDYLFGSGEHAGREVAALPSVTLLDLHLPLVPGLDVLRAIRADPRTRRMPVVILTSSNEERDVATGYDLGVNSYIQKPVDFERFAEAIRQLGLYWLILNESPPPKPPPKAT